MSFHRGGGPAIKKKLSSKKKPGWDDSVHDLTVYRATPQEVLMRKESHKSKNHMSITLEKMKAEQKKKLTGVDLHKLAIMKEVLYDQHQLQQVLAKSDSMMAVVKDLFGDDPKRSMGFPNVTTAPQAESGSTSLVNPIPAIYTRSEKLSDSVMNQSAINEVDITDSSDEDDGTDRPEPISYKSKLNLQHFQEFLQEEERTMDHINPPTLVAERNRNTTNNSSGVTPALKEGSDLSHMLSLLQLGKLNPELLTQNPQNIALLLASLRDPKNRSDFQTPSRNDQLPVRNGASPPSAINDTQKVKKTKKQPVSQQPSQDNANTTMTDMRQALKDLEGELAAYEHQTGRIPKEDVNKTETFSGYTVALVSAVSRLTKHLKETDLRIRSEVTLREQLTQDVYQLRAIIDALASDLIMTQEEYAKLYSENQRYKETKAIELASMNKQIVELQTIVGVQLSTMSQGPHPQHQSGSQTQDLVNTSRKSQESRTSTPNQAQSAQSPPTEVPPSSSAVLLSPVVRKTRVHSNTNLAVAPMASKRQTSLVDVSDLASSNSRHSSDPPQLTQAPPVMKSISVPRPISLVQSNLPIPLTSCLSTSTAVSDPIATGGMSYEENRLSDVVKLGERSQEQLNQLQELAVEEALQNPALQDLMQTQIAELNRQQEEARKRLRDLLANQKLQQQHLQEHLGPEIKLDGDWSPPPGCRQQMMQQAVSPPISPISSPQSDRQVLKDMENLPQMPRTKGITLTLPMADLDVSGGSLTSPPRSYRVKLDE